MAQTDYIRSVELTNNTNNIKSKSITGKTFVADYGNNYWTIAIKTIPMSQKDFYETLYHKQTTVMHKQDCFGIWRDLILQEV